MARATKTASIGADAGDIPLEERSAINPNRRKGKQSAAYSAALKQVVATVHDTAKANIARDKKATGRPTAYTPELAEEICRRHAMGETMVNICDTNAGMPHRMTVLRWAETIPSFASMYARARVSFGEYAAHHVITTAKAATPETAAADRILVDAFKWYAEKAAPRLFNSRIAEGEAHREATTINNVTNNVVISARDIAPEDRERLRSMLLEARAANAKPVNE